MTNATPMTPAQYRAYLDSDVLAFIDETDSWYPPDTYGKGIEEQRRIYDAMCRAFVRGYPPDVTARERLAGHVPLRHYRRTQSDARASVLYMHGGSNVLGGLDSHDDVCADICQGTGFDVVAVDYRLQPEHSRADSLTDCATALDILRSEARAPVILAGDSAGGFLAAALAVLNRGADDLAGLALIYPSLAQSTDFSSMTRHANAPLLSADELRAYLDMRGKDGPPAPMDAPSLSGLPPVYAAPAECDPLADHARAFVDRIRAEGGVAVCQEELGLVHGHLRARNRATRAEQAFARLLRAMSAMGRGVLDQAALETAIDERQSGRA